ncbi:MAG: hydrogenase maturation protease [Planctomycetota bacterium]|jgi:hydrogenase maturation protease
MSERCPARLLCLGNDLLADDAFGCVAAARLRPRMPAGVEVVFTTASGFALMDHLEHAALLVVIDTVMTGNAEPGTVYVLEEEDLRAVPGGSPHYVGLFETLALGRKLELPVPERLVVVAVEAADCTTLGGAMHPAVAAAVPIVVERVAAIVRAGSGLAAGAASAGGEPCA